MKASKFTIKDYVLSKSDMDINGWINQVKSDGLSKHEHTILSCADHYNKITVDMTEDLATTLIKAINNCPY